MVMLDMHIKIQEEDKKILVEASKERTLKLSSFIRSVSLKEAKKILNQKQEGQHTNESKLH